MNEMKIIITKTVMEMVKRINEEKIKKEQIVSLLDREGTLYLLYY